jgi:hypothetical protein
MLAFGIAIASAGFVSAAAAQAPTRDAGQWVVPRTPEGHPDLQGNWTNATVTPLERPNGAAPTLTQAEVDAIERPIQERREERITAVSDPNRPAPPVGGDGSTGAAGGVGGYNTVYIESGDRVIRINGEARAGMVIDPPDGRIPSVTADASARARALRPAGRFGQYDNPENRPLGERCILSFGSNAGPPMLPNGFYNNNYTIVQTPDHIAIMTEMIHDTRIIRIGDGPRLPADVRPYFGDSWGHWEGDTLVIETTNIHPAQSLRGAPSENLRIIERLTRVDEETILYRFTVDDPTSFESTWTAELPFTKLDGQVYEYACHEGNYALSNVLSGARYQERRESENQTEPR